METSARSDILEEFWTRSKNHLPFRDNERSIGEKYIYFMRDDYENRLGIDKWD